MQSYPSPSAVAADSGGPFYSTSASQPPAGLTHTDDLPLELSRGVAPMMHAGPSGGGGMADGHDPRAPPHLNHHYGHENQPQGHLQANHAPMGQMGAPYGTPDGSVPARKRSKVSRACDECRRKKIRCDATGDEGNEQCSSCKRVGTRCQFSRVPMKRGPSKGYARDLTCARANRTRLTCAPSRYIKELADRLNTLEGVVQASEMPLQQQYMPNHESPLQRRASDDFSPPPNNEGSPRKRTYSTISGEFGTPYQQQRPPVGAWSSQEPLPRHLPHPSPGFSTPQTAPPAQNMFREPNYSPNGLHPLPQWRNAPEPPRQPSGSFDSAAQAEHGPSEHVVEWNESLADK